MLVFLIRRVLSGLVVLWGLTLLAFLFIHMMPGDPAQVLAGPEASREATAAIERRFGLDRPIAEQYLFYLRNALQGDLGRSYVTGRPAVREILQRYPTSLTLALLALTLAAAVGVLLGVLAAVYRNTVVDVASSIMAMVGLSIPNFWLGLLLIYAFSVELRWLPTMGTATWRHWILPSITLSVNALALVTRMTRSNVLEVLELDFVRTARSKGQREALVIYRHVLKSALIPTVTVLGYALGFLIGGAIVVEVVFNVDGVGRLAFQAILGRDIPLVQASLLFVGLNVIVANLLVDLTYAWLDPRIRYD